MMIFRRSLVALLAFATVLPLAAVAAQPDTGTPTAVAVIVTVPTPPGVTRERLQQGFLASVPEYKRVPGLIRKYFTADDKSFGGVYLFQTRQDAERHFDTAWHDRVKSTYGIDGTVTYFDAPVQITGDAQHP